MLHLLEDFSPLLDGLLLHKLELARLLVGDLDEDQFDVLLLHAHAFELFLVLGPFERLLSEILVLPHVLDFDQVQTLFMVLSQLGLEEG